VPRSSAVAQEIVDEATVSPWIDLIAELAEPLAEHIVNDYGREDWQDSPLVQTLARVPAPRSRMAGKGKPRRSATSSPRMLVPSGRLGPR
jgi:hypothetical protein